MNPRKTIGPVVLITACVFLSCAASKPSIMQKRHIESQTLHGSYDNVFKATLTVLQDNGYIIKNVDKAIGLITGTLTAEASFGEKFFLALGGETAPNTLFEVSAILDEISENTVAIRVTIQKITGNEGAKQITDPEMMKSFYNEIQIEVKRREALGR